MRTWVAVLTALAFATPAGASDDHAADIVRAKIEDGAKACMAGRPADVVKSYARDITLQYPGVPDQDYAALVEGYRSLCGAAKGSVESIVPTFEELYVAGPVVVARLTWKTRLRGMPEGAARYLRDVQIWENRKGEWTFVRGVHFPVKGLN